MSPPSLCVDSEPIFELLNTTSRTFRKPSGAMKLADTDRKKRRRIEPAELSDTIDIRPPRSNQVPNRVTVVAVGPTTSPTPLVQGDPSLDAVHFVQVSRELVLAGTIEHLRDFVADLGMAVADMERDMLTELVEEGRRRRRNLERRLA